MGEYNGRINVSKDSMLFVVNSVFNQGIKESTTKENILKLMPDIYENADDEEIIKMLPYRAYKDLERLIEYVKTSDDIKAFFYKREHPDIRFLEEAMIIVMRAKYHDYNYSINPGVIEKLTRLFSEENKKIAERYGDIENLTVGMLYEYGIVDFDFLRKQLCKYMNEIQSFVTYLDEEESPIDIGEIADGQKARKMKYKQFSKQEILKREEYLCNEKAQKLYQFLKSKNDDIHEWAFKRLVKKNELGINILGELSNMCMFEADFELKNFMDLFTDWYNNSPQYMLGGYSPIEFRNLYK